MTFEEGQRFVREAVCKALRIADIKHEAAAAMMGITAAQFSSQLAGREHLSMQRLMQIEDQAFWFVYLSEIRAKQQVMDTAGPEVQHALSLLIASIGTAVEKQRRMAKAQLPEGVSERRRRIA